MTNRRLTLAWAEDVTATLEPAFKASGCDQATVVRKPRLLSNNVSSYLAGDLAEWLGDRDMEHIPRHRPDHIDRLGGGDRKR
jgi:transposase InsO family protein